MLFLKRVISFELLGVQNWLLTVHVELMFVCVCVCRCHSTFPHQRVDGEITARSRPPCPTCPSLSVPVPPAACHGRARPWRMVRYSTFRCKLQNSIMCLSVLVLISCVFLCGCRIPAQSLHLLVRPRWQPALAFHTGRRHQISRGALR